MGLQNSYVYHNNNITQSQITNLEIIPNAGPLWIDYNLIHNIFVLDLVIVKLFCIAEAAGARHLQLKDYSS